jgi:hypothetical protein
MPSSPSATLQAPSIGTTVVAARRKVGSVTRRGILSGHLDQGNFVGASRNGRGTFRAISPEIARRSPASGRAAY